MNDEVAKIDLPKLIKKIVLAVLALLVVAGNFFFENSYVKDDSSASYASVLNVPAASVTLDNLIVRPQADFENDVVLRPVGDDEGVVVDVGVARFWANFSFDRYDVNLVVGDRLVLIPKRAVFDFEFVDDKLTLVVLSGDLYVGFLKPGADVVSFVDEFNDGLFVNRIVVPQGFQVSIDLKQLDSVVAQLLYSKLVKEIRFFSISPEILETDWVKANLKLDSKLREDAKRDVISGIIEGGISSGNDFFDKSLYWSQENLVFVPEKRLAHIYKKLFGYLDDAVYYYHELNYKDADIARADFDVMLQSLPAEYSQSPAYYERYDEYLHKLAIFDFNDPFYFLYFTLLEKQFNSGREPLNVVNDLWLEVYKGLDAGDDFAIKAFDNYSKYILLLLENLPDQQKQVYLTYQNQLLDNLFLKYPLFYKEKYFSFKSVLERRLLNTYVEGQLHDELEQFFIDNKIALIKRLQTFFFEEQIGIDDTRAVLKKLIEESQFFLDKDRENVAVLDLFQSELEGFSSFAGYLSSPEYNSSSIYGLTHKERYETYLAESEYIWSFVDLRRELLGQNVAVDEGDIDDVLSEVNAAFDEVKDLNDFKILPIKDPSQRYIDIEGVMGGYPFVAKYDRNTDSLKDIYAYDQLVADRAVKIGSLLDLLRGKFADIARQPSVEKDLTEETNAERIARVYIVQTLVDAGLVLQIENVESVNKGREAIYRVTDVNFEDFAEIKISFDYSTTEEKATNVLLLIKGASLRIDGAYALKDLKTLVEAGGDVSKAFGVVVTEGVSR